MTYELNIFFQCGTNSFLSTIAHLQTLTVRGSSEYEELFFKHQKSLTLLLLN